MCLVRVNSFLKVGRIAQVVCLLFKSKINKLNSSKTVLGEESTLPSNSHNHVKCVSIVNGILADEQKSNSKWHRMKFFSHLGWEPDSIERWLRLHCDSFIIFFDCFLRKKDKKIARRDRMYFLFAIPTTSSLFIDAISAISCRPFFIVFHSHFHSTVLVLQLTTKFY